MTVPGMGVSTSGAWEAAQQDLDAKRKEYLLLPPPWARPLVLRTLADERDAPVAYLFLNITGLVVPAALLVFLAPRSHLLGAAYLAANYGLFITRFLVALLHVSEHRRLFRPGAHALLPCLTHDVEAQCVKHAIRSCLQLPRSLLNVDVAPGVEISLQASHAR